MSHTPGPWEWQDRAGYYHDLVATKTGRVVHSDGSAYGEYDADIDVKGPDARLIAAAPELLEACEALLQINNEREPFTYAGMWEWKKRKYEAEQKARTAIAKARGEA